MEKHSSVFTGINQAICISDVNPFCSTQSLCLKKHTRESKTSFHIRTIERSTYRRLWHGFTARVLQFLLLMFHSSILPVFYGQMHNHLDLQTVSPGSTLYAFRTRRTWLWGADVAQVWASILGLQIPHRIPQLLQLTSILQNTFPPPNL